MCEESNLCILSWQRPPTHSRGHGNISNYFINCSTNLHRNARREERTINVSTDAILHVQLQPYRLYNCCVAAVNEAGRGSSSCQTVITHEAGKL